MKRSMAGISMAMALSFAGGASAIPMELITNGGFETGDFTGWTATDLTGGSGSWFVDSVATTPVSSSSTVGPASGGFYAVTDQGGPGTPRAGAGVYGTGGRFLVNAFVRYVYE